MVDLFVGRQRELQGVLDLLASPGEGTIQEIVGVRGMGKSTFLQRLSDRARNPDLPGREVRVHSLDMQLHDLGVGFLPGDLGANASLDMVREVFTTSRQIMKAITEGEREFRGFHLLSQKLALEASFPPAPAAGITLGRRSSIGKAEISVKQPDDAAFRQHIRALQGQLDDGFLDAWEEFTARRRVLITVDTFQFVADNELGQWLIRMAKRLRNTLTVIARTPSDARPWRDGSGRGPLVLPLFSAGEIGDYLQRRLSCAAWPGELARATHDFTDGHPEGVNLVGNLIMNKGGEELRAAELRRLLDGLPDEEDHFWAGLVVEILQAVQGDDLLTAVNAAAVAGVFDGGLLAELINPEDPQEAAAGDIIAKLSGLRMLHPVPAVSGGPSNRFRLHEFIRQSVAFRLRANAPGEWRRLQEVVAQHYFRRIGKWEEDPYDSYGAWYRYEDADWQELKREWLRHSGFARDKAFVTRARFTLVFLEAFWWWGVYLPFPFMRWLLDDWSRASSEWAREQAGALDPLGRREDPNQVLLTALTDLVNDYPETHVKPSTSPWDAIRDNLIKVRALCGLSPAGGLSPAARRQATAEEQAEITRADAFITVFLAHSRRFRDPADPSAVRLYDAALTAFRRLEDDWTCAWLVFERADLALERRDLPACAGLLAEGAVLAAELAGDAREWDRELIANLHRAWADVCWLSGRPDKAARHYGLAVAHAYWFHGEPSSADGEPHGPDHYTQQFYREMTLRAAERIAELAGDPERVGQFIGGLLGEVPRDSARPPVAGPAAVTTISELQKDLFPPGPTEDELRLVDTPFMERWSIQYLDHPDPLTGLRELARASLDDLAQQGR